MNRKLLTKLIKTKGKDDPDTKIETTINRKLIKQLIKTKGKDDPDTKLETKMLVGNRLKKC